MWWLNMEVTGSPVRVIPHCQLGFNSLTSNQFEVFEPVSVRLKDAFGHSQSGRQVQILQDFTNFDSAA